MRTLEPAPASFYDSSGAPRFGSYRGALPPIDLTSLAKRRVDLVTQRKRWMYWAIVTPTHYIAVAGAHLGYAITIFAFVYDNEQRRVIADRSTVSVPIAQRFGDRAPASASWLDRASLQAPGARFVYSPPREGRRDAALVFEVGDILCQCEVDAEGAPEPIGVVAKVPGGVVNATEKRALLKVSTGRLLAGGRELKLTGGLVGYDYTHGLLARRTAWRWAFAMGTAKTGERVAFNLCDGFVGEAECALWVDGDLHALGGAQFAFDAKQPLEPWSVKSACGAIDLQFKPGGMHAEQKNFGVISSRFVQPVGAYRGTIRVGNRTLELEDVLGVTEDQDVLW